MGNRGLVIYEGRGCCGMQGARAKHFPESAGPGRVFQVRGYKLQVAQLKDKIKYIV